MKPLVNVKELAEILNVPVSWVYQRTCMGRRGIPYYKMGKHIRFDVEEVKEFFKTEGKVS